MAPATDTPRRRGGNHPKEKVMNRTTIRATLAMTAIASLSLTACGGDEEGGGDGGGPIKLGVIADLTGATGDVGKPYNEGMMAYIEHVNSEGGIEGRKIEAMSNDYAYEVPKAEELYKQYLNDDVVAIQGWGTGDTEALHGRVASDKLPFMSGSFAESLTDPGEAPYNFVVAPTYSDQMRIALNWIADDAGGDAQVAVLHHDSPFGQAPVEDGKKWIDEKGLGLGYQSYAMPAGSANYVGVLQQAKSQGAKYVVIQNVASPAAQVAKDIKAQGLDMKVVCLNWCSNEGFITTAGDAAEGHMMVQPFAPMSAGKDGHKEITEAVDGADGKSVAWVQGWAVMDVMAQGMEKVIKDGNELTGENIKAALESMGEIDTKGLIGDGTVQFSEDSHRGSDSAGVYQVKDGKLAEVTAGATP